MENSAGEFAQLLAVVRELRTACPWDREQTLEGLGKFLIEEAYESADAIERQSADHLRDELGDLLVQVLFCAVIGQEREKFSPEQILCAAREKLIRRHPHVYAGVKAESAVEVVRNWETLKATERAQTGAASALEGIARAIPALVRAQKLGERARTQGMDWTDIRAVLAKVREELAEIEEALATGDNDQVAAELGDMMLALANAPRFVGHDAEETLRRACDKFTARFVEVERLPREQQVEMSSLDSLEIDALWHRAKARLKNNSGV